MKISIKRVAEVFRDGNKQDYARFKDGSWSLLCPGGIPSDTFKAAIEAAYQKLKKQEATDEREKDKKDK